MTDIDNMIAWESGTLDKARENELFQQLVDTGLVWRLQGSYGRNAAWLISQGRVTMARHEPEPDRYCSICEGALEPSSYGGFVHADDGDDGHTPSILPPEPEAPVRRAVVSGSQPLTTVQAYLPSNYSASADASGMITITGTDRSGWTLDGYVLPRLASGLIAALEVTE